MKKKSKSVEQLSCLEIVQSMARTADDKKAEDIVILDVHELSGFADYFLILSGRSTRHVQGLAEILNETKNKKRAHPGNTEGMEEGLWILLDFDDIIVHIFYNETRKFYDLEGLWHDAPRVPFAPNSGPLLSE